METLENDIPHRPSPWSGLGTRAASAVILGLLFIAILYHGGWLFTWLVIVSALMMMREWSGLTEKEESLWRFIGLFYVSIPCTSLIWLRDLQIENLPDIGRNLVLFLMVIVWATDIGAYFVGRTFGQRKLAPTISPGKTWEGLGGGAGVAIIAAEVCSIALGLTFSLLQSALIGLIIALIAQGGDLFESWMKRRAGVKDSGTLIPGHGGLLDRIDGLMFTLPLFALVVYFSYLAP